MYRNLFVRAALCIVAAMFLFGCENSKQLAYFQDLTDTAKTQLVEQYPYEQLKLQVDDEIQVLVTSSSPEASQFFNITSTAVSTTTADLNSYRVAPDGTITFPVLGDIQVLKLSTLELKEKISKLLTPYLKDAVVSVRLLNFKVTVIGEVANPIIVPVKGERMNVIEAIGAAGDMTVYSKRYNIKVLRKSDKGMEVAHLNFNYSKIMQSPYFQLRQNDVIYVEPEKTKGISSERLTVFLPILVTISSLVLTVVTLVTN